LGFFYCRMCIHSISSESVCNHDFMFNSLHDIYAVMFPRFVALWEERRLQLGLQFIQTVPQPVQVHTKCDHRVQSKRPDISAITTSFLSFLFFLITIHIIASFDLFSQTIIQVSTEITKIIQNTNRTKHAHCSTTV